MNLPLIVSAQDLWGGLSFNDFFPAMLAADPTLLGSKKITYDAIAIKV